MRYECFNFVFIQFIGCIYVIVVYILVVSKLGQGVVGRFQVQGWREVVGKFFLVFNMEEVVSKFFFKIEQGVVGKFFVEEL